MPEYGSAQFDRRQYPRLDFAVPFAFQLSDRKYPDGITANISLGGLLVNLPYEVTTGQILTLSMRLPDNQGGEQAFQAQAEVVWAQSGDFQDGWICQAGLRFFEMSPHHFNAWKNFLDTWYKK